jgi:hypothetical protein
MAILRVIYEDEPDFPPTVHHPDAVRYRVGDYWVDAVGGKPAGDEVDKTLGDLGALVYKRRSDERARLAQEIIEKAKAPWWSAE